MTVFEVRRYSSEFDFQSELNSRIAMGYVLDSWKVGQDNHSSYSNFYIVAVFKKE